MIKRNIRKFIQRFGWDLHRLNAANNSSAQLYAVLSLIKANILFDVGANIGQFALDIRSAGFDGEIISFEPLSSAHIKLSNSARIDKAWCIHPRTAVGDRNGEININIAGNSVSSSILPMLETHITAARNSSYVDVELTPLGRLDSIGAGYLKADSQLFIKIDTQGYEKQVLDGAKQMLQHAKGILLELSLVPLYDGQLLWREMIEHIEMLGFTLWSIQPGFTDNNSGRTLQLDAIFIRP